MFRITPVIRAVSPFFVFIKRCKGNAMLNQLPVKQRGKAMGKMYHSLSKSEKAELVKQAKVTPHPPRRVRVPRVANEYAKFIGKAVKSMDGPVKLRFKAAVALWNQKKNVATGGKKK